MFTCIICGSTIPDGATTCDACGETAFQPATDPVQLDPDTAELIERLRQTEVAMDKTIAEQHVRILQLEAEVDRLRAELGLTTEVEASA